MVAVFDIGNTNIHAGLYDSCTLSRTFVFPVRARLPATKVKRIVTMGGVEGVAIASVVPRRTRQLRSICEQNEIDPVIVSWKSARGLKYRYHDPATLGSAEKLIPDIRSLSYSLHRYLPLLFCVRLNQPAL